MVYFLMGMGIQAICTALLAKLSLITLSPAQQFIAGCIFLAIAAALSKIPDMGVS